MLKLDQHPRSQLGFTMIEVLITMVILAIGILGIANLQGKMQLVHLEAYQRAQAVIWLEDIAERINANRGFAANYVTTGYVGTGTAACTPAAANTVAANDLCTWSNLLQGGSEAASGVQSDSIIGGRGCITQIQAANANPGICRPAIYGVTVVWQGMSQTRAPAAGLTCGQVMPSLYGGEAYRRAIFKQIVVGLTLCQ